MNEKEQYPHHLWEGDGSGSWSYAGKCREETAGWDPVYSPTSGLFARHNSVVYMPADTKTLPEGTQIMITDDESGTGKRVNGTVHKYDRGRFHNRLWI